MGTPDARSQPPEQLGDVQLNILAFCCHYCAYAAADLAGSLRLQYPPSVRVVKLPCTGKLDVLLMLGALEHGADGVMVAGCLEGDCHYQHGNLNAKRRVGYVQALLAEIGLEPERVRMFNMSSAMGQQWADAVTAMDGQIRALGPSPLRRPADGPDAERPWANEEGLAMAPQHATRVEDTITLGDGASEGVKP